MKTSDYVKAILSELSEHSLATQDEQTEKLVSSILNARKVFVAGAGRSGLMGKAFAMRLTHIGIKAYVIGETNTPAFTKEDLFIVGSGSGRTETLLVLVKKAKAIGGRVATFTLSAESPIADLSDEVILLSGAPKDQHEGKHHTIQPMGSLFEQSLLLMYDAVVLRLMEMKELDTHNMYGHHANLE
ncbi:6-phospho 3-hexuloisomerase [Bacillus xiamenensis]|uniref:6-phospho-3-hexuloisomerase n=1 Tax=Bacillus xiamenensis TaxID=1178537 RepID=A0AAC9III5_9BACI|nr:6-phospho-3-hexuloisomerase [Bacillus xiamenensis]AOZ89941.1 6-phospho 3-hexuloisomerase [Bacillus xiamenensis]MBG9911063.1 6-phospho 3-hexuloisomerase [Bacillus xiamenensis]MCY9575485.1 6-phospho-3-hexuloisomerase [Bacillus xiamenensis]